jgi:hypothetical protein
MYVQIINFHLKDISEEDYSRHCEMLAPAFSGLPGLVSKTWLAEPRTNTYGGVYLWRDRESLEGYTETDIYKGMLSSPHLEGVTVRSFAVMESPTRITRGFYELA